MLTFTISIRLTGPMGEEVEEKDIDWKVGDNPPSEYLDDACLAVLSVSQHRTSKRCTEITPGSLR